MKLYKHKPRRMIIIVKKVWMYYKILNINFFGKDEQNPIFKNSMLLTSRTEFS